jgi:tetratricopeptide (TPR) repeat protein
MIKALEALDWLNQFDRPHLSINNRDCLDSIYRINAKENEVSGGILQIINFSSRSPDPWELPEALLHVGIVELHRGWEEEAEDHLTQAYTFYAPDSHRRAVAAWILGIAEWRWRNQEPAHYHWSEARKTFEKLVERHKSHHDLAKKDWYADRVKSMSQDLCGKVPEIVTWLAIFEPLMLSESSREISEILIQKIRRNQIDTANNLLHDLERRSGDQTDYLETPAILVECGKVGWEAGNLYFAAELIERAVARFSPRSHLQAVARWMLGAVQWQISARTEKARRNWERSIEDFEYLALRADLDNRQKRKSWYEETRASMGLALREKIKESYSDRDGVI